ncbi:hypothetical protein FNH22_19185 [Fulvivirga sp. M361]|uniref:hypothetical protein n=1 Tax=Fulvivirga sp. M361 TaxID=2594266 RepID=UPI00117B2F0F|nr:hypothetical protein [Fulvivirga sp. M361]TRX54880.1 hypothetical protein FNH22_19185 [Fulvivirga sp. M361]
MNVRVTQEIPIVKEHRLVFNVYFFNFLNLLDEEWGGFDNIINEDLYNIESFDPNTRQIQYSVRDNFGKVRKEGNGFTVMMGLKYEF